MDKELLKKIESAMDKAMANFKTDENSIFNDEKERLKNYYEISKELKKWKKKQTCIVINCNNKSIERSHTVQKSGSLKEISEDGHLLTPRFNTDIGEIEIIPRGVNEASTFPGYCSEHEKLFSQFETQKDFKTGNQMKLQLYRSVCREIVICENQIKSLELLIKSYKDYRDKKIGEDILKIVGEEIVNMPSLEFKSFKFKNEDSRLHQAHERVKETKRYLNKFLYVYHNAILNDLSKDKFQKTAYKAIVFDKIIPVALTGRGNFYLKVKSNIKLIEIIFNVIPMHDKTFIFIASLKKNSNELNTYMSQFVNPLEILSLIERWMIHGSDHWFIKPSIWNKIDKSYQIQILEEILNVKMNIGQEFGFSIFNDLKSESISLMEQHYSELNEPLRDLLNKEKKKLTYVTK